MSTSSNDSNDTLREQVAQMAEQLARLQGLSSSNDDPQIKYQRSIAIFYPSDAEASRYPSIKPEDPLFFFKNDITDDELTEQFRDYPKNNAVGYEPPKILSIIQCSPAQKAHDSQIRAIQRRIAHLTSPVDLFLHQVWSLEDRQELDPDVVDLCFHFAIIMRTNWQLWQAGSTQPAWTIFDRLMAFHSRRVLSTWSIRSSFRMKLNPSRLSLIRSKLTSILHANLGHSTETTAATTAAAPTNRVPAQNGITGTQA
ncbi:hypothetical protein BGZ98_003261, partial [Dissophora globulifera]